MGGIMRQAISIIPVILSMVLYGTIGVARDIPYTLEDRERLIRVETKLEEGYKALHSRIDAVDKRIDAVDKRIDDVKGLLYVLIAAIFAQTVGVVGFVVWDRRTALSPAINKTKEIEEKEDRIITALKQSAMKDKNIAEALRKVGML